MVHFISYQCGILEVVMKRVPRKDKLENFVANKIDRERQRILEAARRKRDGDYWISARSQKI